MSSSGASHGSAFQSRDTEQLDECSTGCFILSRIVRCSCLQSTTIYLRTCQGWQLNWGELRLKNQSLADEQAKRISSHLVDRHQFRNSPISHHKTDAGNFLKCFSFARGSGRLTRCLTASSEIFIGGLGLINAGGVRVPMCFTASPVQPPLPKLMHFYSYQ